SFREETFRGGGSGGCRTRRVLCREPSKTVACRPFSGWATQTRCAGLQLFFEKLRHTGLHLVCKPKLLHPRLAVVIRPQSAAWLVRVGTQEIEDETTQLSGIFLQVVKKVDTKKVRRNIAFPARGDRARVRAQEHPSATQVPNYFVAISHVKRFNLAGPHFHGQV